MTNIIEVRFGNSNIVKLSEYFQYNKGMLLKFVDLDLEDTYQVHFANSEDGESYEMIGDSDGVEIPREVFKNGTRIYAYLYLHPTDDSSITAYEVIIPIKKRADLPTEDGTTSQLSNIDQAIIALNDGVAKTESNVAHYPTINEDGYWCTWDADSETFVSTGFKAEGVDGSDGENGVIINLSPTAFGIETRNGTVIDDTEVTVSLWGYDGVDRANVVINNAPVITGATEVILTTDSSYGVTHASFTMQEGADLSSPINVTFDCYINGLYLPRTITIVPVADDALVVTLTSNGAIISVDEDGYTTEDVTINAPISARVGNTNVDFTASSSSTIIVYPKSSLPVPMPDTISATVNPNVGVYWSVPTNKMFRDESGILTINVVVNGITIELYYPYTVVRQGATGNAGADAKLFTFNTPCIIIPTDSNGYTTTEMTRSFKLIFQNMAYYRKYQLTGSGKLVTYTEDGQIKAVNLWSVTEILQDVTTGTVRDKTITGTIPANANITGSGTLSYSLKIDDATTYTATIPWVAIPTL